MNLSLSVLLNLFFNSNMYPSESLISVCISSSFTNSYKISLLISGKVSYFSFRTFIISFFLSHRHFLQNSCNYSSIPLTIAFNLDTSILHTNVCSPLVTAPILRRCRDDTPDSYSGLFWTLTIYYYKQLTRQDRLINPGSTFQQWVSLSQLPVIMKTDFKI